MQRDLFVSRCAFDVRLTREWQTGTGPLFLAPRYLGKRGPGSFIGAITKNLVMMSRHWAGLKITAGQQKMSNQNGDWIGQNNSLAGHVNRSKLMIFDDAKLNETICGLKSFARYYGGNYT